jgi:hypothetical protein
MEASVHQWQPNEKECLLAILETLIEEGLLATRQKLGYSEVALLDTNFWTNIGLDGDQLAGKPALLQMLLDFLPYFWLPADTMWQGVAFEAWNATPSPLITALATALSLPWRPDGNVVFVETMSVAVAQFIQKRSAPITQVIALLGPSQEYVATAWQWPTHQYHALISRDTLHILDPHIRWNMIYGSRML